MEKTFLEKRIEEKAIERFDKEYNEFISFIIKHPFAKRLTILTSKNETPILLANFGVNYGIFNENQLDNELSTTLTNLASIKENIINEYIKKETDALLTKIDSLKYIFEQL